MVHHSDFYQAIRNNTSLLKEFLKQVCTVLELFARLGIVHADLKPDNIMIDYDHATEQIRSLKIIDYGSAFLLNPEGHILDGQQEFASSTPEYLPPEIQQFLARRFTSERNISIDSFCHFPFVFDVWSLGSILVELLSGFPLWLSLKSRVQTENGNSVVNYGLFGFAGRDNMKIMSRQLQVLSQGYQSLQNTLRKGFAFTGQTWT